jgi:hypothetical protein
VFLYSSSSSFGSFVRRSFKIALLARSLSVRPHVTTRERQDGVSRNIVHIRDSTESVSALKILVKIGQTLTRVSAGTSSATHWIFIGAKNSSEKRYRTHISYVLYTFPGFNDSPT